MLSEPVATSAKPPNRWVRLRGSPTVSFLGSVVTIGSAAVAVLLAIGPGRWRQILLLTAALALLILGFALLRRFRRQHHASARLVAWATQTLADLLDGLPAGQGQDDTATPLTLRA